MKNVLLLAIAGLAIPAQPVAGLWDATVTVNQVEIPFRMEFAGEGAQVQGWFFNGDEKITSTAGWIRDGQLALILDHYATWLRASLKGGVLQGTYGRPGREYAFRAERHKPQTGPAETAPEIGGLWEMAVRSPKGEAAWRLIVRQTGNEASAAILRVDGDTGALTGAYRNGKFVLSHFSGARPGLMTLTPNADGSLHVSLAGKGEYTALRPAAAREKGLEPFTDPSQHTRLKEPEQPLQFRFPDLTAKTVTESAYRGKVVLLNITGSWCPNCHDEAPFLAEIYAKYRERGLEIVAVSFEEAEQLQNPARLRAFINQYNLPYTVLLGGEPSELQAKLPQAVNLNSWPTTFFLGRDGRVRHIHAGFAGPASGELHEEARREFIGVIESLLATESN